MAFRDETEALRHRVHALREELDALARERRELQAAREALGGEVDARARAASQVSSKRGGFPLLPIVIAVAAIGASLTIPAILGGSGGASLYGVVREASGAAPATVGTRCAVFLHDINESDARTQHDAQLTVMCDQRLVYGGGSRGYLDCAYRGDRVVRCVDDDFTDQGGDPRIELDVAARSVTLDDRGPAWRLAIELTTPPSGVGALPAPSPLGGGAAP